MALTIPGKLRRLTLPVAWRQAEHVSEPAFLAPASEGGTISAVGPSCSIPPANALGRRSEVFDPVPVKPTRLTLNSNGWGASAVDALSTAIVMQNRRIVNQIVNYIPTIDFSKSYQNNPVSLFETTMRYLGGKRLAITASCASPSMSNLGRRA